MANPGSLVYFIEAENGLVKIGFAGDFDDRLRRLRCQSPVPLDVLALVAGGRVQENAYHDRFKQWKHHGEWFEHSDEVAAEIARLNVLWPISVRPTPTTHIRASIEGEGE